MMKKKLFLQSILMLLSVLFVLSTASCSHEKTYDVTYSFAEGGYITGSANQTVKRGKDAETVTAVASDGYIFVRWSDGETDAARTDTNITKNIKVTAEFERTSCTVNYSAEAGGRIDGKTSQTVKHGDDAETVTAAADGDGYVFVRWSDGEVNAARTDTNVTKNINVIAEFKLQNFSVSYSAQTGGRIVGKEVQNVTYGKDAEVVQAVATDGYYFVCWSDGEISAIRKDTFVTKNIDVTAEFERILEGEGTQDNPFIIKSYQDFLRMSIFPDSYYLLANDLDLSGKNHTPVFDNTFRFGGTFDGGGFAIKNLTINTYFGFPSLFGFIDDTGKVQNLNLTNGRLIVPNFNTTDHFLCAGFIAGVSFGEISGVNIEGIIKIDGLTYDGVAIGGLVGEAIGLISNCQVDVKIEMQNITLQGKMPDAFNVGGLSGVLQSGVFSCTVNGEIIVTDVTAETIGESPILVGGLAGYSNSYNYEEIQIKNCFTNININSSTDFVTCSGFIAKIDNPVLSYKIEHCGVNGDISAIRSAMGFSYWVSSSKGNITITDCYVEADITSTAGSAAGFIGTFKGGQLINCYATGNIVSRYPASGFCHYVSNVNLFQCYSACTIIANKAAGFIYNAYSSGGVRVEECFSTGSVTVSSLIGDSSGFIFLADRAFIKNCYSTSDVILTAKSPDDDGKLANLNVGGMFRNAGLEVINCYYAGKIIGNGTYYSESRLGAFSAYIVANAQIINCHVLLHQDSIAQNAIFESRGSNDNIDITSYKSVLEMTNLSKKLNDNASDPVWVDTESGLPQLSFMIQ